MFVLFWKSICPGDLIIIGDDQNTIDFKKFINNHDLGPINHFLGINVKRISNVFNLSQSGYIDELVTKFQLEDSKPQNRPIIGNNIVIPDSEDADLAYPIRSLIIIIGALLYISSWTRPDINGPVNLLSQYMHLSNATVFKYGLQILKYLKTTKNLSLILGEWSTEILGLYIDASHNLDRKSQTGVIILFYGFPVYWLSKRQSIFARSSFDAELFACHVGIGELDCIYKLIYEMNIKMNVPIPEQM